ncbi:16S rRNA (adenine(1518)-N(6)/adenine(1519)-N(6))-dimethyltransferase RsmA [Legionella sp. W05-934-2]|uniref:16S rRNA (adenine(1518)-N(6)/adenine(1519)-N(6))- dimethyltransferase RsmA n=1 Tax=Legionella sp. W05-934-2 TaxID=1198649 RepID=UPI003461CD4E
MKIQAKKRFGQNFLRDERVVQQILYALDIHSEDHIVEIGPGMGVLTQKLCGQSKRLTAIEIDRDLIGYLHLQKLLNEHAFELIEADALTVDFSQWPEPIRVVGNLPYNISTPLIMRLLGSTDHIQDMHFMLQKEVVERICAEAGNKTFGRLSVICQYYCQTDYLFDVPPTAFHPQPKVESAVVRLTPHKAPLFGEVPRDALEKLVAQAFSTRRKTLANNLKPIMTKEDIEAIDIDPGLRPEQLEVFQFVKLTQSWMDSQVP